MLKNKLKVIIAPDPRLKIKAKPVQNIDAEILSTLDQMLDLMYATKGIGLAAPQVGISKRLVVMDIGQTKNDDGEVIKGTIYKMINPEITWTSEEENIYEEGCLSLPDQFADVTRPEKVKLKYTDENNVIQEVDAGGLFATCVQHEVDHLDGIIFVDHVSRLKRGQILKRLKKIKKDKE
ncbi:MAG: peptide deformylase [Alphaproteobacteria bacterium]